MRSFHFAPSHVIARQDKNTSKTDPITLNNVNDGNAVYLTTDVTKNRKISAVYAKSTLDDLVRRGRLISPLTRKPFTEKDIAPAPVPGHIHPALHGVVLAMVLAHSDTIDVITGMKSRERLDLVFSHKYGRTQRLNFTKLDDGGYRMNLEFTLNFRQERSMADALKHLKSMLTLSSTHFAVKDSKLRKN